MKRLFGWSIVTGLCAFAGAAYAGDEVIVREIPGTARCVIPEPLCPPAPACCRDAKICFRVDNDAKCFTEEGLAAFMGLWREAAAKGIENATIRAFNGIRTAPPCVNCEKTPPAAQAVPPAAVEGEAPPSNVPKP